MGVKERIEARMMANSKKKQITKTNMQTLNKGANQAEEEKLPSATRMRAVHNILKIITQES